MMSLSSLPLRIFASVAAVLSVAHARPACSTPIVAAETVADRIAVTTTGAGPDVILIPGLASSAHVWDTTVAHLQARHRVHVVQVAGFAGMAAGANANGTVLGPVIEAIHLYVAQHKLAGAAVIGHSLGGLMALKLAVDHPGDAGRIMVVDALPFIGLLYSPDNTVAAAEPVARAMRDRMAAAGQEQYAAMEPRTMSALVKSKGREAEAATQAAVGSDHAVVAQAFYDDAVTDVRPAMPSIAVPLTILYPWDEGRRMPQAAADALYRDAYAGAKTATLTRIDGSYHFIMIDQPEAFRRAVETFLN